MANLSWLLLDFTDPRFNLTREQKREIRRRARRIRFFDRPAFTTGLPQSSEVTQTRFRRRSMWARVGGRLPFVVLYAIWMALFFIVPQQFRDVSVLAMLGVFVLLSIPLWIITCWISLVMTKPWYRYAMYELGYEICADCGYPLFGLDDSKRCPECGWRKTHRDDPPPVKWTDADRATLHTHGYDTCETCGGILLLRDSACPRCGEHRTPATSRT